MFKYITDKIRKDFKSLKIKGDLKGIVEYLSSIIATNDADDMLAGFCYWNISDSYAMLRKPDEQYNNHFNFSKLLEGVNLKYRFWAVCDATQRFTLELGGYGDFWWELYKNAMRLNPDTAEIERIVFDTNVAAISINPKVETAVSNLYMARDNFDHFLKTYKNSDNIAFYKLVYSSLVLKGFGDEEYDILDICNTFMPLLKVAESDSKFAIGEWECLNAQRSKRNMAQVGINRAINVLIDVGKKELARELYKEALNNGLTANKYIENRL